MAGTVNIQALLDKAKAADERFRRTGSYLDLIEMVGHYAEVNKVLMDELHQRCSSTSGGRAGFSGGIRNPVNQAGDNPPPGLQLKIQIATQAYQAFMLTMKSMADGKAETQRQLSRF